MSVTLRIIIWFFGSLSWAFWMFLAYQANFLGMLSDGDKNAPYFLRFIFAKIPFEKTPKNKKRILLALNLFGIVVITALCLFTQQLLWAIIPPVHRIQISFKIVIKTPTTSVVGDFFIAATGFRTHLNATCRWLVAATSSKTGGYIYFCPMGKNASRIPQYLPSSPCDKSQYLLYWFQR